MCDIDYWSAIVFVTGALTLCVVMLFCGYFLGGRSSSSAKNVPFESGVKSVGNARIRFSVKFYLIAMVFVIFDVEGIYMYIWAVSIRDLGWIGFSEILIFIFVLLVSLVYLIRIGMFNWVEQSLQCVHRINYLDSNIPKCLKKSNKR